MTDLCTPLRLGALDLPNRIIMAPMTRSRADESGAPHSYVADYYAQRATAGLILSEALFISPMAKGYVRTPGLVTNAQTRAWRGVTDAVHNADGRIFAQLYHAGRVALPEFLPSGALPIAPSARAINGFNQTDEGKKPFVTPRALETEEVPRVAEEFGNAAARAIEAGFDGVEVHAASGYLIQQFLDAGINDRTDRYGGSAANRIRFLLDVVDATTGRIGADRVGVKVSPRIKFNGVIELDADDVYPVVARELSSRRIAYLHGAKQGEYDVHCLRSKFKGAYLAGAGFDSRSAKAMLKNGAADAIVFGKPYIANPDLTGRLRDGLPVADADQSTIYSGNERGYVDYPTHS